MSKKCPILRTDNTDRLREKRTRGGEGVKKAGKSAYVLYGCSLTGKGSEGETEGETESWTSGEESVSASDDDAQAGIQSI